MPESKTTRKRVLITGAAGAVGQGVRPLLLPRYALRVMFHRTAAPTDPDEEVVRGDIRSLDDVRRAVAGVDAIVHLAANPHVEAPWADALAINIAGTYHVYEAARELGVRKVVLASTNHVSGYYELEGQRWVTPEMPVRPDGYYGASKAFGEALGRYYADAFGLSIICLRIGSFQPRPQDRRHLSTWLSPRDLAQLTWRAIESDVRFLVCYAISGNTRRYWDITSAQRVLGYEPEDNAEEFAGELEQSTEIDMTDDFDAPLPEDVLKTFEAG
ncbi:MAG: NAD(P)-dependent oxidoreductase [Chloroflexi bacterium]|nr:NAD(P)-dependent oxidoreductase [Chloroflexota bacterium]